MAEAVKSRFKSSFYGYVKSSSLFDTSLVETLLAILDSSRSTGKTQKKSVPVKFNIQMHYQQLVKNNDELPEKGIPIFITGQSFYVTRSFGVDDEFYETFRSMSHQKRLLKESDRHLYYIIFSPSVSFEDAPEYVIVDDDEFIYFLERYALSRQIVVLNTTNTILSVHHFRESVLNEWDKHYLPLAPKDEKFNKKLANRLSSIERRSDNYVINTNYTDKPNTYKILFN